MKTAARVMLIIGMVLGCWLIFPIVIGVLALVKLEEIKKKDDLLLWALLSLFLVNLVAGIIMLCMSDEDLLEDNKNESLNQNDPVETEVHVVNENTSIKKEDNNTEFQTIVDKLEKLHDLKEKNIISEEEFNKFKKDLLEKL